ncbi:MAG: ferritin family protein [Endomicrobiales bacterium]|nr:ferritin family protein [Endomicrobiales bacterium]
MAEEFSVNEVVEMAVQIEKNGRDFYSSAAKNTQNETNRETFKYLAEEEKKHIDAFQKVLSQIENYEPSESYTPEYFSYLKILAGEHVFTKSKNAEAIVKSLKNDIDIIDFAIGIEKDSIIFYYEMKGLILGRKIPALDEVIKQEQEHFAKLTNLKLELLKSSGRTN